MKSHLLITNESGIPYICLMVICISAINCLLVFFLSLFTEIFDFSMTYKICLYKLRITPVIYCYITNCSTIYWLIITMILLHLIMLQVRNSSRAWLGDLSVPSGIAWGHSVLLTGNWHVQRFPDDSTHMAISHLGRNNWKVLLSWILLPVHVVSLAGVLCESVPGDKK